ncbi:MAG: sulfatase-like hydrolase/transferase [Thermoproteus sp.]
MENIALIVLDTLRWDYSADFDWLNQLGFRKYMAWTTAPWTLPAHISMFTSLYPSEHGVHEPNRWLGWNWLGVARERALALMNKLRGGVLGQLKDLGYKTVGLSANPYVNEYFGFKFDEFYDISVGYLNRGIRLNEKEIEAIKEIFEEGATVKTVLKAFFRNGPISSAKLLAKSIELLALGIPREKGAKLAAKIVERLSGERPVFLFMNLMEVHEPYTATDWARSGRAYIKALVDGRAPPRITNTWRKHYPRQVRYLSNVLRRIVAALKGFSIVVVSDHGQMLGEHGALGHGYWLYDELVKVPLWVKSPRRIKLREPVSLATVYSILLNIADGGNIEQRPPLAESFGPLIAPSQKQFVDSIDRIKELYRYRSREPGRIYPN